MKRLLTATFASLALFTFAPVDLEAGGKKKNKRAKAHKYHNNHHQKRAYSGHHHSRSHNSVRFSFGQPAYRSYYRPAPRYYSQPRHYYSRSPIGFSGLSLFFGGGGSHCR